MSVRNKLTTEQYAISYRNRKHLPEIPKGYCYHHKDENMLYEDVERYIQWNLEDLEVITMSEHTKHHNQGRAYSEESIKKFKENAGMPRGKWGWRLVDGKREYYLK